MGYGQPGGSYGQPGVGYGQSPMGYGQPGMGYGPMGYGGHGQNFASGGCGQPMPRPTCGARRRKYRSHYRGQGCGQQGGYGSFSLALSFGFGGSMI